MFSPFSRRTEKCAQLMLQFTVLFGAAHTLKSGHCFYDDPWLTVGVTIVAIFAAILGLLFGVDSAQALAPCIISLSDLHRRGAFVVHTHSIS